MLLGNSVRPSLRNDTEIKNLEMKNSVKILEVHFTYDSRAKRGKLNFDEIVTSINYTSRNYTFYEECLRSFAKCSVANNQCEEIIEDINETLQIILWNNKLIRIDGKPVFYRTLGGNGIFRIGDLISENNELITKCNGVIH